MKKQLQDGRYRGTYFFTYPDGGKMYPERGALRDAIVRKGGREVVFEYVEDGLLMTVVANFYSESELEGVWRSAEGVGEVRLTAVLKGGRHLFRGKWVNRAGGTEGDYDFEIERLAQVEKRRTSSD